MYLSLVDITILDYAYLLFRLHFVSSGIGYLGTIIPVPVQYLPYSVVDRRRFDADPDCDPTPTLTHVKNQDFFHFLTALPVYIVLSFCRIPILHFFSQSRRLLTKNFKSVETVNEKFRCL